MVIPVYNVASTIGRILLQVTVALPGVQKQIIIVDHYSTDGSTEWLRRNLGDAHGPWHGITVDDDGELRISADGARNGAGFSFLALFHERNRGKGAAVRTGFQHASGNVIVVQNADLEYDANDWSLMLPLIVDRRAFSFRRPRSAPSSAPSCFLSPFAGSLDPERLSSPASNAYLGLTPRSQQAGPTV